MASIVISQQFPSQHAAIILEQPCGQNLHCVQSNPFKVITVSIALVSFLQLSSQIYNFPSKIKIDLARDGLVKKKTVAFTVASRAERLWRYFHRLCIEVTKCHVHMFDKKFTH